jgi:hypothetical protein
MSGDTRLLAVVSARRSFHDKITQYVLALVTSLVSPSITFSHGSPNGDKATLCMGFSAHRA